MESSFAEMLREELSRSEQQHTAEDTDARLSLPSLEDRADDPGRWVVNLDDEFRELSRFLAKGGKGPRTPAILAGATGAGKSLLLVLADRLAAQMDDISGERTSAYELLQEDESGVQFIEYRIGEWQSSSLEGNLDFLLIDDVRWHELLRGRLRQLGPALRSNPPGLVFAMNFFDYHKATKHDASLRQKWDVIVIPPYESQDLEELWNRHADGRWLNEDDFEGVLERSIGNPELLLDQLVEVAQATRRKGGMNPNYLRTLWSKHGYDAAINIREDFDVKETKRQILIEVCHHGGSTATQLSDLLGHERSLCSYHLSDLAKQGVLKRKQEGPRVVYFAPKPVERAVETFLVMGYE